MENTYHLLETEKIQETSSVGLDRKSGVCLIFKSFSPKRWGNLYLFIFFPTAYFTWGSERNRAGKRNKHPYFKSLATLENIIPEPNSSCLQQESSEKPACTCQLKFVVFFRNPNRDTSIDVL